MRHGGGSGREQRPGRGVFSPTEFYWLFFPILPRCDCRLSASDRDEGWYPGLAYLIAFSPIMANRRMAEARVGRSGSSLR
jgi:hypothetical protein